MKAKRITIKGDVHDVGYRLFLMSEAEGLCIEKFDARNVLVNREQHLIVLVEGAEEKIDRFVAFAESYYPPAAAVESIEVKDYEETVRSIDAFRQSFMVFQLTKIAQAGVGMLGKQDKTIAILESVKGDTSKMLGKQDKTIAILESVKEDTSEMLGKQDVMIEKQDETIKVIKGESKKTRETVCDEGEKTREVIKEESEKTREVLKEKIVEDVEWLKDEIIELKVTLDRVKEKVGVV